MGVDPCCLCLCKQISVALIREWHIHWCLLWECDVTSSLNFAHPAHAYNTLFVFMTTFHTLTGQILRCNSILWKYLPVSIPVICYLFMCGECWYWVCMSTPSNGPQRVGIQPPCPWSIPLRTFGWTHICKRTAISIFTERIKTKKTNNGEYKLSDGTTQPLPYSSGYKDMWGL